ncbi:uncharacterized protein LOC126758393 [Bactrocera neohumeralis]|uniref:uncharacterized protein LOC126758393 n=1 Tax=Bactrocera neohumeralis TaxID=98809 RepID=UPI002166B1A7|nr:uncharacterized protein LOC126758393 [Bactrocera neohumeralis]
MENKTVTAFSHQVKDVCVTAEAHPQRRLTTSTKPSTYGCALFVVVVLTILAQFPQHTSAAALPQQVRAVSESFESAEDTWELLHQLARFIHREHKTDDIGDENVVRRIYKRHNTDSTLDKHNDEPAWHNVCGRDNGWSGDELAENLSQDYIKLYMKNLRETVRLEYKSLRNSALHGIDIDDMRAWRRHERKYKFLPTLERNATIAPVCWHRSLQIFIASFDYLHEIQQKWDQQYLRTQGVITRELQELLQSAKRILCEIETDINGCFPRRERHVASIPRAEMFAQINFYTKTNVAEQHGVHHTDLRFVKFFYQNYLLRIWKTLPRHPRHIEMSYTCKTNTHPTILDKSLEKDASILNADDGDDSAEEESEI